MASFAFKAVIAILALMIILGVWVAVHLLAQRRFGQRHLGCSGPILGDDGSQVCCHTGKSCDSIPQGKARDIN